MLLPFMTLTLLNDLAAKVADLKIGVKVFSSPVRKYRKSYCTMPSVGIGVSGGGVSINTNVKVLRQIF